jgi:hypothetical protein
VHRAGDPDCTGTTYPAGTAYIEATEPHIVRNEGATVVESNAFFLVPTGVGRRIEESSPGNCPF